MERRQEEIEWRANVESALRELRSDVGALKTDVGDLRTNVGDLKGTTTKIKEEIDVMNISHRELETLNQKLEENTRVTLKTSDDLQDHRDKTAPIIDAIERMEKGVVFLGLIASGVGKVALWLGRTTKVALKYWMPILGGAAAIWVALKEERLQLWDAFMQWWNTR